MFDKIGIRKVIFLYEKHLKIMKMSTQSKTCHLMASSRMIPGQLSCRITKECEIQFDLLSLVLVKSFSYLVEWEWTREGRDEPVKQCIIQQMYASCLFTKPHIERPFDCSYSKIRFDKFIVSVSEVTNEQPKRRKTNAELKHTHTYIDWIKDCSHV